MLFAFIQNIGPWQLLIVLAVEIVCGVLIHMLVGGVVGLILYLLGQRKSDNDCAPEQEVEDGDGQSFNQDREGNVNVTCPACGNLCEIPMATADGQHLRCPYCSEKFTYQKQ